MPLRSFGAEAVVEAELERSAAEAEALRVATVGSLFRMTRRISHRALTTHYISGNSWLMLDDNSFGFFNDDVCRVFGIVSEV